MSERRAPYLHWKRIGLTFILFLVQALLPAVPAQKARPASEKWFVITIAEKPVGYSYERVATGVPDIEAIHSTSDTKMVLNRLGAKVELRMISSYEETKDGLLKKVGYEMQASVPTRERPFWSSCCVA